MKKIWILLAVIAVGAAAVTLIPSKTEGQKSKFRRSSNPVPNRYIVAPDPVAFRSEDGTSSEEIANRVSSDFGGRVEKVFSHALQGFTVEITDKAAQELSRDPRVMFVEQDSYVSIETTQNNAPWGLDRVDQRNVPLSTSYNYVKTGSGVHVYVIDTGVRTTHSEFGGRATADYDSVYDGQNGQDCHGHGTHVAATIGGTNYGVAKGVRIHAVRVLACNGIGTVASAVEGIDWVTAHHQSPAIANMSMGAGASPLMDFAVQGSIDSGVTYVVAAGNSNASACDVSPARLPGAITVGASDQSDIKAAFSNFGPCVDLFAPGVSIVSAWYWNDFASFTASGTSMATPHVAGTVALYLQDNPAASPAQATNALLGDASSVPVNQTNDGSPNLMVFTAPTGPTAAEAVVSGQVIRNDGRALKDMRVVLRNASSGTTRVTLTNAFGYFTFSNVEVGEFYTLGIQNKRYVFANSPYSFTLGEDFTAAAFVGTPMN
ncbi:MAG: S8 family serine peptidase [Acidobacteria bacterium]|nr:S8 family serine peptidase [Acidobacteriota bacterium]